MRNKITLPDGVSIGRHSNYIAQLTNTNDFDSKTKPFKGNGVFYFPLNSNFYISVKNSLLHSENSYSIYANNGLDFDRVENAICGFTVKKHKL